MELKVWVEGIQRIVCGVTEATTCQDVVFALAHATNKIGRFTLIERWRNNERHLAPTENPLKILMKWGEYSSDVQFILQQSEAKPIAPPPAKAVAGGAPQTQQSIVSSPTSVAPQQLSRQPMIIEAAEAGGGLVFHESKTPITTNTSPPRSLPGKVVDLNNVDPADQKKLDQLGTKENVGVVRGVPQHQKPQHQKQNESPVMQHVKPAGFVLPTLLKQNSPASHSPQSSIDSSNFTQNSKKSFTSMEVRNNLVDRLCTTTTNDAVIVQNRSNSPIISNNGALVPPPYRDPPPPTALNNSRTSEEDPQDHSHAMLTGNQYRDLVQLIKLQRDQMAVQQMDLTKLDQEIEMLEQRDREQASQMEAIAREIMEQDQLLRQGAEQLQSLQYVEEESELMMQQEKTLSAEISLLRSKLANCETELLQCRNKVKLLVDDIQLEQRAMQFENRTQMEAQILNEMERLQGDIEHIVKKSEGTIGATTALKHEISFIEGAIADKKKQVEQLVHEMKEVNLQSLSVVVQPSEEIRHLLEGGATRPGSTRRIIGSPRQLENAVPTSKNPHGVWV